MPQSTFTANRVFIEEPQPGAHAHIVALGSELEFGFDPSGAVFEREGGNLLIHAENGGSITLEAFFTSEAAQLPDFIFPDGALVAGADYLIMFSDVEMESASNGWSSGIGEYRSDTGELVQGIESLGLPDAQAAQNAEAGEYAPEMPLVSADISASAAPLPEEGQFENTPLQDQGFFVFSRDAAQDTTEYTLYGAQPNAPQLPHLSDLLDVAPGVGQADEQGFASSTLLHADMSSFADLLDSGPQSQGGFDAGGGLFQAGIDPFATPDLDAAAYAPDQPVVDLLLAGILV